MILLSCSLREENPLLMSRIRKKFNSFRDFFFWSFGERNENERFNDKKLGNSLSAVLRFFSAKSLILAQPFKKSKTNFFSKIFIPIFLHSPVIFFGTAAVNRDEIAKILPNFFSLAFFKNIAIKIKERFINIILTFLGKITAFEAFASSSSDKTNKNKINSFSYLYQTENDQKKKSFSLFHGFFKNWNSFSFSVANIVLPSPTYVETISFFINLEGRIRLSKKILGIYKYVFADWEVLQFFSLILTTLKWNFSVIESLFQSFTYFFSVLLLIPVVFFILLQDF